MELLVFDTETTTKNKGSPWTISNKLCYIGAWDGNKRYNDYDIEYGSHPYGSILCEFRNNFSSAALIIGFNLKFDLHWIRRYGVELTTQKLWDCQVAHFLITGMINRYPSLNEVAEYYKLGAKLDKIKEYWDSGIDTPDIPEDELREYLKQDVSLTFQVYEKQKEFFNKNPALYRLFTMQMYDEVILAEMEWNGLLLNKDGIETQAEVLEQEIEELNKKLYSIFVDHLEHSL